MALSSEYLSLSIYIYAQARNSPYFFWCLFLSFHTWDLPVNNQPDRFTNTIPLDLVPAKFYTSQGLITIGFYPNKIIWCIATCKSQLKARLCRSSKLYFSPSHRKCLLHENAKNKAFFFLFLLFLCEVIVPNVNIFFVEKLPNFSYLHLNVVVQMCPKC